MEEHGFIRWWIWFWYNDKTRLLILIGIPSLIICIIFYFLIGPGEYLRIIGGGSYIILFAWAILDNDYSNLRRIGMDEYRRKLNKEKQNVSKS